MTEFATRRVIEDKSERLHRQVPPKWVDDDQPSWQAFCTVPKDEGELSVSAGSRSTPESSCQRFVERGFSSYGVLSVTVEECAKEALQAHYDPLGEGDPSGPDEAHAIVDFNGLPSRSQQTKKGKALLNVSWKRGWTYRLADRTGT